MSSQAADGLCKVAPVSLLALAAIPLRLGHSRLQAKGVFNLVDIEDVFGASIGSIEGSYRRMIPRREGARTARGIAGIRYRPKPRASRAPAIKTSSADHPRKPNGTRRRMIICVNDHSQSERDRGRKRRYAEVSRVPDCRITFIYTGDTEACVRVY